jgi:hypothetical protein
VAGSWRLGASSQSRSTVVLPFVTVTVPGIWPGGPQGVTGFEGGEGSPWIPRSFTAVTVNVYSVSLVRPSTTADVESPATSIGATVAGDGVTM